MCTLKREKSPTLIGIVKYLGYLAIRILKLYADFLRYHLSKDCIEKERGIVSIYSKKLFLFLSFFFCFMILEYMQAINFFFWYLRKQQDNSLSFCSIQLISHCQCSISIPLENSRKPFLTLGLIHLVLTQNFPKNQHFLRPEFLIENEYKTPYGCLKFIFYQKIWA